MTLIKRKAESRKRLAEKKTGKKRDNQSILSLIAGGGTVSARGRQEGSGLVKKG